MHVAATAGECSHSQPSCQPSLVYSVTPQPTLNQTIKSFYLNWNSLILSFRLKRTPPQNELVASRFRLQYPHMHDNHRNTEIYKFSMRRPSSSGSSRTNAQSTARALEWWNCKVFWQLFGESFAACVTPNRARFYIHYCHCIYAHISVPVHFRPKRESAHFLDRRADPKIMSLKHIFTINHSVYFGQTVTASKRNHMHGCARPVTCEQCTRPERARRLIADDRLAMIWGYFKVVRSAVIRA